MMMFCPQAVGVSTVPLAAAQTTQQWLVAPTTLAVAASTHSLVAARTTIHQLPGRTTAAAPATPTATDAARMASALPRALARRVGHSPHL